MRDPNWWKMSLEERIKRYGPTGKPPLPWSFLALFVFPFLIVFETVAANLSQVGIVTEIVCGLGLFVFFLLLDFLENTRR